MTETRAPAPEIYSQAVRDVIAERVRQVVVEGFSADADDCYRAGELGIAAALYAIPYESPVIEQDCYLRLDMALDISCGFDLKPEPDARRRMVKAAALIIADIERHDRAALSTEDGAR